MWFLLLLKVGTAVVTRSDGRLALGRLGALCEQVISLSGYSCAVNNTRTIIAFLDGKLLSSNECRSRSSIPKVMKLF